MSARAGGHPLRATRGRARLWRAVLATLLITSGAAHADDALDARYFDAQGRRAYAERRFDDALRWFLAEHRITPTPATRYNIALCAQFAGHESLAWSFFEAVRRDPPVDDRHAQAEARQAQLTPSVAIVDVRTEPPGAFVQVDDGTYGRFGPTPTRVALPPGEHTLHATRDDHRAASMVVHAARGRSSLATLTLPAREGTVTVVAPTAGRVTLTRDDGLIAQMAAGASRALLRGRYTATLTGGPWAARPRRVEVLEGETTVVSFEPATTDQEVGRLVVESDPPGVLYIDGRRRAPTPVVLRDVAAGRRRLEVRREGFVTAIDDVDVRADETTRVRLRLQRTR